MQRYNDPTPRPAGDVLASSQGAWTYDPARFREALGRAVALSGDEGPVAGQGPAEARAHVAAQWAALGAAYAALNLSPHADDAFLDAWRSAYQTGPSSRLRRGARRSGDGWITTQAVRGYEIGGPRSPHDPNSVDVIIRAGLDANAAVRTYCLDPFEAGECDTAREGALYHGSWCASTGRAGRGGPTCVTWRDPPLQRIVLSPALRDSWTLGGQIARALAARDPAAVVAAAARRGARPLVVVAAPAGPRSGLKSAVLGPTAALRPASQARTLPAGHAAEQVAARQADQAERLYTALRARRSGADLAAAQVQRTRAYAVAPAPQPLAPARRQTSVDVYAEAPKPRALAPRGPAKGVRLAAIGAAALAIAYALRAR